MTEVNDFDSIRISLASPEQIKSWSYGEVTKPETINYRTLKPERDGLFCERIFGPTKDFECSCGKYKRIRYKGLTCDKCGVEVARAKVRRERMGHIELACPVGHIWFTKGIPSRVGLLLDISARRLERVLYFSHFIITAVNEEARQQAIDGLGEQFEELILAKEQALANRTAAMETRGDTIEDINKIREEFINEKIALETENSTLLDQLTDLAVKSLLSENQYYDLKERFPKVFEASMGAEAILSLLRVLNLNDMRAALLVETRSASGQRRKKASKQLQLVEALRRSGNKPEWMIMTVLPVLPPDLRPMVQLDGGRFATSDLNDLYRRVINRNNRLKHLAEIDAPDIIVRNEKRMLQEAVDSLIDNGRRGRTVSANGDHKAKSLSDMLRGKQGRFRQNLLGKRVDYSGRSVIVVGPFLKLHQMGLPRKMALELFKPFIMHRLVESGEAPNIKSARRLVEQGKPEVYDILEEIVKDRPVMINRAPTLHRLSIQAFEPVLIDGSAIRIHPLVCTAFNADFDGDQMAVHVPLSSAAVRETKEAMLSSRNMLLPSSGEPVVTPTLDMVYGCYYLTTVQEKALGTGKIFASIEDALLSYDLGIISLRAMVKVRRAPGEYLEITPGRLIFNMGLPSKVRYINKVMDKGALKGLLAQLYKEISQEEMAVVLDNLKEFGFKYATKSGLTISMSDVIRPSSKDEILSEAENKVSVIEDQFAMGFMTEDERYKGVVNIWMEATEAITESIADTYDTRSNIYMMADSGAKGNVSQIRQMAGLRGLMTNPSGRIIDFPIKSSLREGLSTLEYFISTHGARKGLTDTALRTSGSGYLTRRLVDVTQDVIILQDDCGTEKGIWIIDEANDENLLPSLAERISGRYAQADVFNPQSGEIIVAKGEEITVDLAADIAKAGITQVYVRSALACNCHRGLCQKCYGKDLASGQLVEMHTAVGIIAAQSIGEPGTQLTLRTFHTGGVAASLDITTGLPRVEELFEARVPKGAAIISEIDGMASLVEDENGRRMKITSSEFYYEEHKLPSEVQLLVREGQEVDMGTTLAAAPNTDNKDNADSLFNSDKVVLAKVGGIVTVKDGRLAVKYEERDEREYIIPANVRLRVKAGDIVRAGEQLFDGPINPQNILAVIGKEEAQRYLVEEVQKVYCSQGVHINDKHAEVIVRQMTNKVRIDSSGDTELVPGELADRFEYEDLNAKVLAEGGEPATAHSVLMGITRASLSTESWLAAASFQETTRVLTEAAIYGKVDKLTGLKENVIIGKLIPAQCSACKEAIIERKQYMEEMERQSREYGNVATKKIPYNSPTLLDEDILNDRSAEDFKALVQEFMSNTVDDSHFPVEEEDDDEEDM